MMSFGLYFTHCRLITLKLHIDSAATPPIPVGEFASIVSQPQEMQTVCGPCMYKIRSICSMPQLVWFLHRQQPHHACLCCSDTDSACPVTSALVFQAQLLRASAQSWMPGQLRQCTRPSMATPASTRLSLSGLMAPPQHSTLQKV